MSENAWRIGHERIPRTLGTSPEIPTSDNLYAPLLDNLFVAMHRPGEGHAMAGLLIAVVLAVLFAVLFDD